MSERQAFIRSICDTPEDDTARLVFADWLDEHNESEWACHIRWAVQSPQNSAVCLCCDPRHRPCATCRLLACSALDGLRRSDGETHYVMNRGFVCEARCGAAQWLQWGDAIRREHPVTRVTLSVRPNFHREPPPSACWQFEGDPTHFRMDIANLVLRAEVIEREQPTIRDSSGLYLAGLEARFPGLEIEIPGGFVTQRDPAPVVDPAERYQESANRRVQRALRHITGTA